MQRGRPHIVGALVVTLALAVGCVGSSGTDADYLNKANKTVDVALSSVQTVALTVDVIDGGGAYDPYLGRVIGQAEKDAVAAQGSFDVVQPPSEQSDAVREQLDDLMAEAIAVLSDARIAIRRDDDDAVVALREQLSSAAADLRAFTEAHS